MLRLDQKVAIVTGGASGIGRAMVQLFLSEGARVVAADSNKERLDELAAATANYHQNLLIIHLDISVESNISEIVDETIRHFGKLDILVNNAGIMDNFDAVADVHNEMWDRIMSVNLDAPFKFMRKALSVFLPNQSGVIINVASVGGLNAGRAGAAYTASKFGLIGLTKNTGYMYAKSGIRCNAIAPGGVNTHIGETIQFDKISPLANDRIMSGMVLNPRMGEPEEIASVALFLASDDARFINGSVIVADGGWTAY